ncbi:MAG: hypothetical protein LUQ31_06420 [Methanoregula sp.]|nr:hypothetical protein [Methanoregula sp.]
MEYNIDPSKLTTLDKEKIVNTLLKAEDFHGLTESEFSKRISLLVDLSFDLKRVDGLDNAIEKLNLYLNQELPLYEKSLGHYFLANAYSCKKSLKIPIADAISKWDNLDIEKEILNYRLSLQYLQAASKDSTLTKKYRDNVIFQYNIRRCQSFTNLGNLMDNVGRFIEGIEYRNNALSINPHFGMALGNKGISYVWYSRYLYDKGHKAVFLHFAYHLLKYSMEFQLESGADTGFQKYISIIQQQLSKEYLNKKIDFDSFSLGDTDEEIQYRKWCLQNCLYLNPLNDMGPYPIAARDVLHIPTITTNINEGPNCQTLYNLLKQEFVTARYSYYKGISEKGVHFSDKDVLLFNTEDNPVYSKASEEIKNSFRICYSIFDKIAFFLNFYFKLGLKENQVYFKKIWYIEQKGNNYKFRRSRENKLVLNPKFIQKNNLPLLGLFWISKDLFEDKMGFADALEPDAKEWYKIRNHLEHKFLKLELSDNEDFNFSSVLFRKSNKNLSYSIEIHDFERKALKLLKTVRSALIYLVLAMQYEEFERGKKREKTIKLAQITLQKFPDELKINDYHSPQKK